MFIHVFTIWHSPSHLCIIVAASQHTILLSKLDFIYIYINFLKHTITDNKNTWFTADVPAYSWLTNPIYLLNLRRFILWIFYEFWGYWPLLNPLMSTSIIIEMAKYKGLWRSGPVKCAEKRQQKIKIIS